jgi:hypothetical protein
MRGLTSWGARSPSIDERVEVSDWLHACWGTAGCETDVCGAEPEPEPEPEPAGEGEVLLRIDLSPSVAISQRLLTLRPWTAARK